MAKLTPCPKCRRKTWSAKWGSCSACLFQEVTATVGKALATPAPEKKKAQRPFVYRHMPDVTENVTGEESHAKRDGSVTNGVTKEESVTKNVTLGEVCPTCHRKVPMTATQRKQRQRGNGSP